MDNLARKATTGTPQLEYGTVITSDDVLSVEVSFGEVEARRAVGCLVMPEPGDTVLLSVDVQGGAWILSVLERPGQESTTLDIPGDATLKVDGSLTVAPQNGLHCVTGEASLHAVTADVTADRIGVVGRVLTSQLKRVRNVAETVDEVCREYTRRVQNYFRFTEEHEDCQAASRRQLVEETMTVQSKNTVITSEEHVKIDGKLIHMG